MKHISMNVINIQIIPQMISEYIHITRLTFITFYPEPIICWHMLYHIGYISNMTDWL